MLRCKCGIYKTVARSEVHRIAHIPEWQICTRLANSVMSLCRFQYTLE